MRGGKGVEAKAREALKMGFRHVIAPRTAISAKDKLGNPKMAKDSNSLPTTFLLPCSNLKDAIEL